MSQTRATSGEESHTLTQGFYLPAIAAKDTGVVRRGLTRLFRRRGKLGWHRLDDR